MPFAAPRVPIPRAGGRPRPGDRYGEARAYDRRGRSRERILSTALCKLEGTAPLDALPETNQLETNSQCAKQPTATDPRRSDETVNLAKAKTRRTQKLTKTPAFPRRGVSKNEKNPLRIRAVAQSRKPNPTKPQSRAETASRSFRKMDDSFLRYSRSPMGSPLKGCTWRGET